MTISNTRVGATFRRPATRSELSTLALGQLGGVVNTVRPETETLPSGTRFILNPTAVRNNPTLAALIAKVPAKTWPAIDALLTAMTTYGVIATETGGYGCGIETTYTPNDQARWDTIGLGNYASTEPHQQLLTALSTTTGIWSLAKETP
jgi:hypothetical protein